MENILCLPGRAGPEAELLGSPPPLYLLLCIWWLLIQEPKASGEAGLGQGGSSRAVSIPFRALRMAGSAGRAGASGIPGHLKEGALLAAPV